MSEKITYRQAINDALFEEMKNDETVFLIGEDISSYHQGGGPARVHHGLEEAFGAERMIETPICEGAIVGSGVGAALAGSRPIVEIMHSEFLSVAMQHLLYGGSKGLLLAQAEICPVVVRAPYGGVNPGVPFQDESNEQWFIGVPGLKVVLPSNAYDAKGLLKSAIRDNYPVLFLEHKGLYNVKGEVPKDEYFVPLGKGKIVSEGVDVTIVSAGRMVKEAQDAITELKQKNNISCELIDLRTLHPIDESLILQSVGKTGRIVTLFESKLNGGVGNEIVSLVTEKLFEKLRSPAVRIAAKNIASTAPPTREDLLVAIRNIVE